MDTILEQSSVSNVHVRWLLQRGDLQPCLVIETESFPVDQRWDEEAFNRVRNRRNCISWVAEDFSARSAEACEVGALMQVERYPDHYRLINLAVHPECRGRGLARGLIQYLQAKLNPHGRSKIVALVPESLPLAISFCEHFDLEVVLTEAKGKVTYRVDLSAMTTDDALEAQIMEDVILPRCNCQPRQLAALLEKGIHYGVVARDRTAKTLLGYALYTREAAGICINGEYGVVVHAAYRRRGIGRQLLRELASYGQPIIFENINMFCHAQRAFLTSFGVTVPRPEKYATVRWQPPSPTA